MSGRIQTTAVIFMMLQTVLLCASMILVFATPLQAQAAILMPILVLGGFVVSLPAAWLLAPHLDAAIPAYGAPAPTRA